jgi:hypothetical protein
MHLLHKPTFHTHVNPHTDLIHTHFGQSVYAYLWLFQVQLFWHRHSASATGSQGLALPLMLHFWDNWPLNIKTMQIYTEKQPNDIEPVYVLMCMPFTNVCKLALSLSTLTKAWHDSWLLHCWKSFDYLLKLPSPNMMFWKISHPWVAVHFVVEHPVSLCVYLCLNSRHHISPKLEIQTKLINNELGAEQALWNKSNVLIPCIYKEKIWVDVSTKQGLGFRVMAPLFLFPRKLNRILFLCFWHNFFMCPLHCECSIS